MRVDPKHINISEKDLEDYLFENPCLVKMPYTESPVREWIGRQFHVPNGIIDLLGITEGNEVVVIELKNTSFTSGHITQVCKYASNIESVLMVAGAYSEPYKLLIGPYEPTNEIIAEADSVDVYIKTLSIQFDMSIGGHWHFSEEFTSFCNKTINEIAKLDPFVKLAEIARMETENIHSNIAGGNNGD